MIHRESIHRYCSPSFLVTHIISMKVQGNDDWGILDLIPPSVATVSVGGFGFHFPPPQ